MPELQGVAFITGAGSGIGEAAARTFPAHGIIGLSLVDIDLSRLQKVQGEILKEYPGVNVLILPTDVSNEAAVSDAVRETVKKFTRIDIGLNAAGIGDAMLPTHEVTLTFLQKMISINQIGTWLCERAVIQQMLKQESHGFRRGRGVIINVASALGLVAPRTSLAAPSYVAAKHAVIGFTKMDAKFYGSHEIRINAICPGWVRTPMIPDNAESSLLKDDIESSAACRLAEIEEIVDAILFLASPMSSFMYGASLVVDGGYSL